MANPDHLLQLSKGKEAWNEWRTQHPGLAPDLSGADLQGASLQGFHLKMVNLQDANLREADLRQANLQYANLRRTDLRKANLQEADLEGADLTEALLEGAVFQGADLTFTNLDRTILAPKYPEHSPPILKKWENWWSVLLKKRKTKASPKTEEKEEDTFRSDRIDIEKEEQKRIRGGKRSQSNDQINIEKEEPEESGAEPPEMEEPEMEAPADRTAPPPQVVLPPPQPAPVSPEPQVAGPIPEELTPAEPLPSGDTVSCSVYAPPKVEKGNTLLIQVWAHLPEKKAEAEVMAKEFDETATLRQFKTLTAPIERGDEVTFVLTANDLELQDNTQELLWTGQTESVQFDVGVPVDFPKEQLLFTVRVFKNSLPVGQLKFRIGVEAAGSIPFGQAPPQPLGEEVKRFKKAFVSYSSKDRPEVLRRVQMLGIFDVDYFMDVLALDPGERWEKELYKNIDHCDVFLLFWSSNAQASQWVLKELEYAIGCKKGEEENPPLIQPVPIEGPPIVPPPPQLGHMHFNDKILYFLLPYRQ